MARKDALVRLHSLLVSKRDALRKKLADDFGWKRRDVKVARHSGGDVGDASIDAECDAVNSQIAAFESRELRQIERALHMIRTGQYGSCENCEKTIPIARLNALPFTPYCIECQRLLEVHGSDSVGGDVDWESACELEGRYEERELTIGDLEID